MRRSSVRRSGSSITAFTIAIAIPRSAMTSTSHPRMRSPLDEGRGWSACDAAASPIRLPLKRVLCQPVQPRRCGTELERSRPGRSDPAAATGARVRQASALRAISTNSALAGGVADARPHEQQWHMPRNVHGMARSIWSGHLTFGLVSIPVGLHSAVEASEHVSFRLLHRRDHAPIRYKKFCSKEDVEVPANEIVRGYEVEKGKYAVVEGEELEQVHQELNDGDHTIELLQFVDFSSLSPLLFDRPYYLTPVKGADKPYAGLSEALNDVTRVGITRFSLRSRPLLAALLPGPGVLALEVMRETSELRSPDRLATGKATVRAPEVKMARTLI